MRAQNPSYPNWKNYASKNYTSKGWGPKSRGNDLRTLAGSLILPEHAVHERVHGENSRAKEQYDQRGNKKHEGGRRSEFIGIRKYGMERLLVSRYVSHRHVDGQDQSGDAREHSERKEKAAKKFDAGNEYGHLVRHRQTQRREKLGHFIEVVQFAPAALHKLDSPVESHEKQEG